MVDLMFLLQKQKQNKKCWEGTLGVNGSLCDIDHDDVFMSDDFIF